MALRFQEPRYAKSTNSNYQDQRGQGDDSDQPQWSQMKQQQQPNILLYDSNGEAYANSNGFPIEIDQQQYDSEQVAYQKDDDEDYQGYEAEAARSRQRIEEEKLARQKQALRFQQQDNQAKNHDNYEFHQPQFGGRTNSGNEILSTDARMKLAERKQFNNSLRQQQPFGQKNYIPPQAHQEDFNEDEQDYQEVQQKINPHLQQQQEDSNELNRFDESSSLRYQDDQLNYSESMQHARNKFNPPGYANSAQNNNQNQQMYEQQQQQHRPMNVLNDQSHSTSGITGSQLIAKIKEDQSYIENSVENIPEYEQERGNNVPNSKNRETEEADNERGSNNILVTGSDSQRKQLELIKHSRYYEKYLNGESLNDSYSVLQSQSQTNALLHSSTLQNTTQLTAAVAAAVAAAQDASIQSATSNNNNNTNDTYNQKIKLIETNNKLVNEMNKNKQLLCDNAEMRACLDELRQQLREQKNGVNKSNQQSYTGAISTNGSQAAIMMNTFGSPMKSPSFDPATHGSESKESYPLPQGGTFMNGPVSINNEHVNGEQQQQLQNRLDEERSKNSQLRVDLEALRTRLLTAMNNLKQADTITRDQEKVISNLQEKLNSKEALAAEKVDENKKLLANGENFRIEAQNLSAKLKKQIQTSEEIEANKRSAESEVVQLKAEVKGLQNKLLSFTQDNGRLFQEIQVLKVKLEKADGAAATAQNELFAHKADGRSTSPAPVNRNNVHEVNELKSAVSQLSKQLAIHKEKNSFLEGKVAEMQSQIAQNNSKQTLRAKQDQSEFILQREREVENDLKNRQLALQKEYHQISQETLQKTKKLPEQNYNQQLERQTRQEQQQSYQKLQQQQQINSQQQTNQYQRLSSQHSEEDEFNYQRNPSKQFNIENKDYVASKNQAKQHYEQQYPNQNYSLPPQPQNRNNIKNQQSYEQLQRNSSNNRLNNNDNLFYNDLDGEKQRLQKQKEFIPIGVTSVNESKYLQHSAQVKKLDAFLNQLLMEKKIVESDLLKLEENKRKSSQIINQKAQLEQQLADLATQISAAKNSLRDLNALK